jgi:hypothetical protein
MTTSMKIPNIIPELKKVISSIRSREEENFLVAMEAMALKFENSGLDNIAEKIRFESEKSKQIRRVDKLYTLPMARGIDMATVYMPIECHAKSKRLVLSDNNITIINEIIDIYGMREEFYEQEVSLPNKVVMHGQPGTGKTITAFHLAHKLDLPLVLVRLDAVIDSHLGETAANIRKVFDFAKKTPCVLFLDEFDAIARSRGAEQDVKEMSRVVNTLLQCMDDFDSDGLIMAATNLEGDLDAAVWRRFDTKMVFHAPNSIDRRYYISQFVEEEILDITTSKFNGHTYAEIEQVIFKAKRKAIIGRVKLDVDHIKSSYQEYFPSPS